MKIRVLLIAGLLLFVPNLSLAGGAVEACSPNGYTIATMNGIFTNETEAGQNADALAYHIGPTHKGQPVNVKYLLNDTHLGGLGDIIKSIEQGLFDKETVADYDLVEMLRSASEKVTTQKLLLVAHSQGNFYANSFYDSVILKPDIGRSDVLENIRTSGHRGNVPAESIGVYAVATPSGRVAGGGKWLTSDTDKVIAGVVGRLLARPIMAPNTHIDLKDSSDSLGHNFAEVYLKYRGVEIVSDTESALDRLKTNSVQDENAPCLAPPPLSLTHKAEGVAFALADPLAGAGKTALSSAVSGVYRTGIAVMNAAKFVGASAARLFAAKTGQAAAAPTLADLPARIAAADTRSGESAHSALSALKNTEPLDSEPRHPAPPENSGIPPEESGPQVSAAAPPTKRPPAVETAQEGRKQEGKKAEMTETIPSRQKSPEPAEHPASPAFSPQEPSPFYRLAPAGGGGGGVTNPPRPAPVMESPAAPSSEGAASSVSSSSASASQALPPPDETPPAAPSLASPAPHSTLAQSLVAFSGAAEPGSVISQSVSSATTSASASNGAWSLSLSLPDGTTTALFYATDSAGNRSSAASSTLFVDTAPPDISLSVPQCVHSLIQSSCLVATTTLSAVWSSAASDLDYFMLDADGAVSTTTATSTTITALDGRAYTLRLSALDRAGNRSATSTQVISVATLPVVVNEVAWAGTSASGADEWLELYNNTGETIPLADWKLYSQTDLSPYLSLSGSVAPHSYYLIERKNSGETNEATESSVTDIPADLWASFGFGLNNNGEQLVLAYAPMGEATTTIDTVATCQGGFWCAGSSASEYLSMERYDTLQSGALASNWYSHLGEDILNGRDAAGHPIQGTPKRRNSVSYLISPARTAISRDTTLSASRSPYLINRFGLSVSAGATLSIDPGVVVKFSPASAPSLSVFGALRASGTAASPVVFTSLYDDSYGGDTGGDGSQTSPLAGSWGRILFNQGSSGALSNALVRFGGNVTFFAPAAGAVGVDRTRIAFSSTTIEYSYLHGLALANSSSTVTGSTFRWNSKNESAGLYALSGAPSVSRSSFIGNYRGVYLSSSLAALTDNTISSSTAEAVYTSGLLGSFSGNSGSDNKQNAIVFGNGATVTQTGATTTLSANSLPYLAKSWASLAASSTLAFERGVVVKGYDNQAGNAGIIEVNSGGKLYSSGASPADLIFTSIRDGSVGGETERGLGNAAPGDWVGVIVRPFGLLDLSGVTVKFGGRQASDPYYGQRGGALKVFGWPGSSGRLSQALFDSNFQSGLNLENVSALSLSSVRFENHRQKQTGSATGIYSFTSTSTFSDLTFSGNEIDAVGVGSNALTCLNCSPATTSPAGLFSR